MDENKGKRNGFSVFGTSFMRARSTAINVWLCHLHTAHNELCFNGLLIAEDTKDPMENRT